MTVFAEPEVSRQGTVTPSLTHHYPSQSRLIPPTSSTQDPTSRPLSPSDIEQEPPPPNLPLRPLHGPHSIHVASTQGSSQPARRKCVQRWSGAAQPSGTRSHPVQVLTHLLPLGPGTYAFRRRRRKMLQKQLVCRLRNLCICEPESRTGTLASGATPAALPLPPPGSPQGRAPAQMSPYCPQPPTRLSPKPHPRDPSYLGTAPETVTAGSVPTKALWKPGLTVFHFPGAGFHFPEAWGWGVACCVYVGTHVFLCV